MEGMAEWASYKTRSGPLHVPDMQIAWKIAAANNRAPAQWWRVYGTGSPVLMEFAVAVLSQFVTAGACERGWKRYKLRKHIHSLWPCFKVVFLAGVQKLFQLTSLAIPPSTECVLTFPVLSSSSRRSATA